jgi:phage tail P2-like protein
MNDVWRDRPVFKRLPIEGYQNNPVADALTQWVDERLIATKETLENFYRELDPDTAKDSSLDYLAYLVGLSDEFYYPEWSPEVKRAMIAASLSLLWPYRGTLKALRTVLDIHSIDYDIWQPGELVLPFRLPGEFGTGGAEYYIRLPLRYQRSSLQWAEARRTLDNFGTFGIRSGVVYKAFYVGFSRLGEPLFNVAPEVLPAPEPPEESEGVPLFEDALWLSLI